MPEIILSDYFYGSESAPFTFFKMPRQLIADPRFKRLPSEVKLLYGMLLDRMGLSAKNGWRDDAGRVYIYYTVKEVCVNIGCGRNKAMRLLADLDTMKGIGLIERVKQGQGKPDKIFVKYITDREDSEKSNSTEPGPATPLSQVDFSDIQRSEIPTSRGRENRPLEVSKADPNYTNKNQTEFIQINLSISPHIPQELLEVDKIDGYENKRETNMAFGRRVVYTPLLCYLFLPKTSPAQNLPPGHSAPDSPAIGGAVRASMSFVKRTRPLVRGQSPLALGAEETRLTVKRIFHYQK